MFPLMRAARVGFAVSVLGSGPAAAGGPPPAHPPILPGNPYGPPPYKPWASPPGWVGPGPAGKHYPHPGPGPGWTYPGLPGGSHVGYPARPLPPRPYSPAAAVGGYYWNGLSMYGPPVPTYGPIPGVFGGSTDTTNRFFKYPLPATSAWFGLGWYGSLTPSPRPFPPTVNVWPVVPAPVDLGPLPPPSDPTCIRLAIRVPDAAAVVWVDKKETAAQGAERVFESPPLKAGEKYKYDLIAQWTENGQSKAESRTVTATAGDLVVIDFTRPAE